MKYVGHPALLTKQYNFDLNRNFYSAGFAMGGGYAAEQYLEWGLAEIQNSPRRPLINSLAETATLLGKDQQAAELVQLSARLYPSKADTDVISQSTSNSRSIGSSGR